MTVRQLLSNLDAPELPYWIAFFQVENYTSIIPGFEDWLQTGASNSLLANIFSKKGVTHTPERHMPKAKRRVQSYEEMTKSLDIIFGRRLKKD